ncbi:MAG: RNA methyltransferase [Erysipelotrichaceae bacterium]|jgi:23S rRNA (guanosine2251-2'-O)-methyltransferase|nr:RNA methyltransferase [Erysipelotrichaceae bacterium]
MIIEGNVSVKAALMGGNRIVDKLYVDETKHDKDTNWILHRAEERKAEIIRCSREEIDAMASGRTHGGLIAEAEKRTYQKLEDTWKEEQTFAVLLEGVEDPFNLGYIMRTLYSAGCTGLILRDRNWENAESTILKSSAGASEYLPIVLSDDMQQTVKWYQEKKVNCFAAMRKNAISCYEAKYTGPVLIAIGGEMRGLSSGVLKEIPQNIYIPYANDFHSALNAAGAAAVLGFEVYRQRNI